MSPTLDLEALCLDDQSRVKLDFLGEEARFHHIGMVVRCIKAVSPRSTVIDDPIQGVSVALVLINGLPVELIEPRGANSPVAKSLERGVKLLHVCYAVPNLKAAIRTCRKHGFHCIQGPVPARAFGNANIAWVYSRQYGLFELCENSNTSATHEDGAGEALS